MVGEHVDALPARAGIQRAFGKLAIRTSQPAKNNLGAWVCGANRRGNRFK